MLNNFVFAILMSGILFGCASTQNVSKPNSVKTECQGQEVVPAGGCQSDGYYPALP